MLIPCSFYLIGELIPVHGGSFYRPIPTWDNSYAQSLLVVEIKCFDCTSAYEQLQTCHPRPSSFYSHRLVSWHSWRAQVHAGFLLNNTKKNNK